MIDQSGTGSLAFTSALIATGVGSKTLTLQGSSAGTGEIGGAIVDGSGATAVTKSGTGTWTLSGANTYTGGSTVSAGTLQLSGLGTLGSTSGALTVNGGTLDLHGTNQGVGNLTGSGGTILNNLTATNVTFTIGNGNGTGGNYQGVIADNSSGTGTVALTKTGTGTLILSGANTYTGATTVNGGALLINGSTSSASAVTVNSGGTLGGTGTISGTVMVNSGGNLSPGNSPGILTTTGSVTLAATSNFRVDINGATVGTQYDQLIVTGTIDITGSNLKVTVGGTLTIGDQYTIINNEGPDAVTGTFANLAEGGRFNSGGNAFTISYVGGSGNDVALTSVTAVPEPSTWIGGALAVAALAYTQRRRFARLLRAA